MRLNGTYIVDPEIHLSFESRYQRISSPVEHDAAAKVIVVRGLNPNYFLLFDDIDLIVTRYGSALSHLAILARERGIPIFQTDDDIASLAPAGGIRVNGDELVVTDAG